MNSFNILVGTTSAYRFSPNEFREAILGHKYKKEKQAQGKKSKLILFNDDIDPLKERHVKILKRQTGKNYSIYIGTPLFLIPSPVDSKTSLSKYYLDLFIQDLKDLGVSFDTVIESHKIRKTDAFTKIKQKILRNKDQIIKLIEEEFNLDYSDKIIRTLHNGKYLKRKGGKHIKFPWAIECAIRWELTNVNAELFTKNYLTKPKGSYHISSKISKDLLNFQIPKAIKYEFIPYSEKVNKCHRLLPNKLFRRLICRNKLKHNYINTKHCIKILKEQKFKRSRKSYYEILHILSHFPDSVFEDEKFWNRFENVFLNNTIPAKDKEELVSSMNEFRLIVGCEPLKHIEKVRHSWITTHLDTILALQKNSKSRNEFQKRFEKLEAGLTGKQYKAINKALYGKNRGISLATYFFLRVLDTPKRIRKDLTHAVDEVQSET